jgi:hypothetical protein
MDVPGIIWIIGGVTISAIAVIGALLIARARKVNLTRPDSPDQKPEWLRTDPPPETRAATLADGEGITLYDHDAGERLAAPFAEQIEDILRAELEKETDLPRYSIDLGTAPDGSLEIWVDGQRYDSIEQLPDERLRRAFQRAVEQWQNR